MGHFIPDKYDTKKVPDLVFIFAKEIWKYHNLQRDIVYDCDTRFTSEFWSELCKYLNIKQRISILFKPKMNIQTETVNQTIEVYV
jgi:hypothetical protein